MPCPHSAAASDPAIVVRHLAHRQGGRDIYRDLNLAVASGRVTALLGRNGVGKTTLIQILMGFMTPMAGECRVLGSPSHDLPAAVRRRVGLLFEGHLAHDWMTIAETERFHAAFHPAWRRDRYYDLVDRMGLPRSQRIRHCSEGQRSQVVLGLLMAQQPDLLILDDYSMGLDAGYRRLFVDMLADYLAEGRRTVFLTSHVIQDLEQFVDDIIFLERGGATRQSTLAEFMAGFRRHRLPRHGDNGDARSRALPEALARCPAPPEHAGIIHAIAERAAWWDLFAFAEAPAVAAALRDLGVDPAGLETLPMTLEDAFIGYTGRA